MFTLIYKKWGVYRGRGVPVCPVHEDGVLFDVLVMCSLYAVFCVIIHPVCVWSTFVQ